MIKLYRSLKPQILQENQNTWTTALLAAVSEYGDYSKIPRESKEKLLSHYRHDEIKKQLFASSLQKCSFCEMKPGESGNIEVEHFAPKSLYPERAFDWENFLPACRKCNGSKDNHDTLNEPLINPYDLDPAEAFYYKDIRISTKDNQHKEAAELTIKTCGLNSARLLRPRAEILISLHGFSDSLESAIQDYVEADTPRKKRERKRKIMEAIETIENLAAPSEKLSGFCGEYLQNCEPIRAAKKIIEENSIQ